MATGEYLDLATKACYAAQRNPGVTYDLSRAKELVNEAVLSICNNGELWDFLEYEGQWTTTAGSDTYSYSSIATAIGLGTQEIAQILALTNDTDGGPLMQSMSWQALERASYVTQDDVQTGWPTAWAAWGIDKIRLYPTPDQAYELGAFVRVRAEEMSADADTPPIPLDWRDRLIVPYAASRLLLQQGGNQAMSLADRLQARYNGEYVEFRSAFATAKKPTFMLVEPTWNDDLPGSYDYGANW